MIAFVRFGGAPVVVGRCVVGVEGNGAIVVIGGAVVIAFVRFGKATIVVGHCVAGVEGDGAVVVGDGIVIFAHIDICTTAIAVGEARWVEVERFREGDNRALVIAIHEIRKTGEQMLESVLVGFRVANEAVEVIIDRFSRNPMRFTQVFQYRGLEATRDDNNIILVNFDVAQRWPDEYAFLRDDTVDRATGYVDMGFHIPIPFQKNNPAVLGMPAVAGKKEGNMIICGKVNQIGFAAIMLEFGQDREVVAFKSKAPRILQSTRLNTVDVKSGRKLYRKIPVKARRDSFVPFGLSPIYVVSNGGFLRQLADDLQDIVQVFVVREIGVISVHRLHLRHYNWGGGGTLTPSAFRVPPPYELGVVAPGFGLPPFGTQSAGPRLTPTVNGQPPAGTSPLVFALPTRRVVGNPAVGDLAPHPISAVVGVASHNCISNQAVSRLVLRS